MSSNIWYLCKYAVKPGHGYVGMRPYYLMRELSALGVNVDLISSASSAFQDSQNQPATEVISPSFVFHQVPGLSYGKASSLIRILSWLHFELHVLFFRKSKMRNPDVIVVSSPSILSIVNGFIWSRWYGANLVFEVRDIWPLTLVEEGGFSRFNPFVLGVALLERWGYRRSNLIIGTMPNLVQHVADVAPGNEHKVACIPFGYPDGDKTEYFRADYGTRTANEGFVVGYVGTIGVTNALETLLEAMVYLSDQGSDIVCHIVGDGPLLDFYRDEFESYANIVFMGRLKKENVFEAMSKFDILYFGTRQSKVWEFGQSLNKVVDYMLAGKPILASYSGFRSMINEADCGWFVEAENSGALAEELLKLASVESNELAATGLRGREWILQYRKYSALASQFQEHLMSIHD